MRSTAARLWLARLLKIERFVAPIVVSSGTVARFPLDVDPEYYFRVNPDLRILPLAAAAKHYQDCGEGEGRQASPYAVREGLLGSIDGSEDVLEIGPFFKPMVTGSRVKYFDIMDREALVERARRYNWPTERVPNIDYVSEVGDLSIVPSESADVVISAHCVEHQVDLVAHFIQVQRLLRKGGRYLLIAPDKRYTFDYFLSETTLADVVAAHHEKRKRHTLTALIEHRALTTHNDPARHWSGDHTIPFFVLDPGLVSRAIAEFDASGGAYIDVHAWKFTPAGFKALVKDLFAAGLIDLNVKACFGTVRGAGEFCCMLEKERARAVSA